MAFIEAAVVDEFDDDFENVHRQSISFEARDDLFGLIGRLFHFHGSLSLVPVVPVGDAVPEVETSPGVQVVPDEAEDCWFIVGDGMYRIIQDGAYWRLDPTEGRDESWRRHFYLLETEEALGLDGKIAHVNPVDDTPEPYLTVNLRDEYAPELEDLTGDNLGRRLALIIDDDEVVTTIVVNDVIGNGQFKIGFLRDDIGTLLLVWLSGELLPGSYDLSSVGADY
ncbi:MAG TPA: hypothetical protein VM054_04605 [bacterium]|nr:hypothetical protein [bacterium]